MFALNFNRKFSTAAAIFIVAGLLALLNDEPIFLVVPFVFVLIPPAWQVIKNYSSLLFYLLIGLLPLSAEYNFTPSLGMDVPDEMFMMLLTGLAVLLFIHKPAAFPKQVWRHPLFFLVILHLAWIAITCYYSTNSLLSIKFLAAKIWYIIPFVVIPSMLFLDERKLKWIAMLLVIPILFVVIQALIRHSFYQFSFEGVKNTMSPFFRNHVTYSGMLVCLVPVFVALRFLPGFHKKYWNMVLIIILTGIIFSFSRGAWLALLLGAVAAVIFHYKVVKYIVVICIAAIIAMGYWLSTDKNYLQFAHDYNTTIFHEDIGEHLQATVQLKDVSNAERFYRWVAAGNMIAEKPWTGFGPNTFYLNYKNYTERAFQTWVSDNPEHSTVHNYFLLTLLEQGIPGLLLFIMLYVAAIFYCEHFYHTFKNSFFKYTALIIGVLLVMLASLLFSSDLLETDKLGSLFWLSLGLLVVLQTKKNAEQNLQQETKPN